MPGVSREIVAAALLATLRDGACEWSKLSEADRELGLRLADSSYAAINHVAAEKGWHMRPDAATEEMIKTLTAGADHWPPEVLGLLKEGKAKDYRDMLACPSAEFEWDK